MSDFFQNLITEYIHSRPNAKNLDPKRVAKRLSVRKRDFDEFLTAWRAIFQRGVASLEHDQRHPSKDVGESESSDALSEKPKLKPGSLSGVIKKIGVRGAVFIATADAAGHRAGTKPLEVSIPTHDLKDAQVGDEVIVRLVGWPREGERCYGKVVEVSQRATNSFVGTYDEFDGQGYVKIDGRNFEDPISVGDPGAKGAAPGDKVVIEMLRFPSHAQSGEAVLTRVLGAKGEPGVDLLSIVHEFNLPDEFPPEVLREASHQAEHFDETDLRGRLDLTNETILTIDPFDARDFDDAISLKRNEVGHWVLGVHIADVGHFVKRGSVLDREARRRGTSVYLPTRVLPMLPEVISNGLASLQQGRVRYTNSVFIEFTPDGIPVHTEFAKSAIKATQRFAYEEVMPLIKAHSGERDGAQFVSGTALAAGHSPEIVDLELPVASAKPLKTTAEDLTSPRSPDAKPPVAPNIIQLLRDLHSLAMTLRRRRFTKGSLDLNLPEVKLDFDTDGRVIGAHEVEHDESHQLIEEFMLAANIAVATKLNDLEVGFLRRVHAEPDSVKLQAFAKFVATLGFNVGEQPPPQRRDNRKSKIKNQKSGPSPFDSPVILSKAALQKLLKDVAGTPAEHAVNYALLRSLRQAEYSGVSIGHYALAVSEYCHFTSPIRRYPDLTIHRLFDEFTRLTPAPSERALSDEETRSALWHDAPRRESRREASRHNMHGSSDAELAILGTHCSDTERRAAQAERELTKIKLLAFMSTRIGDEFDAIITGVERFGLFCKGTQLPVDGFVHITTLTEQDYFDFDPASVSLIGRRKGNRLRLGDKVRVQVAFVNLDRRELDFRLVDDRSPPRRPRGEQKAVPNPQSKTPRPTKASKEPRRAKRR
ncbi:MAG: ribonuclease R family protein [Planctomycetaceae bacterium]